MTAAVVANLAALGCPWRRCGRGTGARRRPCSPLRGTDSSVLTWAPPERQADDTSIRTRMSSWSLPPPPPRHTLTPAGSVRSPALRCDGPAGWQARTSGSRAPTAATRVPGHWGLPQRRVLPPPHLRCPLPAGALVNSKALRPVCRPPAGKQRPKTDCEQLRLAVRYAQLNRQYTEQGGRTSVSMQGAVSGWKGRGAAPPPARLRCRSCPRFCRPPCPPLPTLSEHL